MCKFLSSRECFQLGSMKYNQDFGGLWRPEKWIIMRIYADCPPTTLCGKTLPVVVQSQAWPSSQAIHVIRNLRFGQLLTFWKLGGFPTWKPYFSPRSLSFKSDEIASSLTWCWGSMSFHCHSLLCDFPDCRRPLHIPNTFPRQLQSEWHHITLNLSNN